MPFAESTQAANLTFDAAVNRALARRVSDTPLHSARPAAPQPGPQAPERVPEVVKATAPATR
jgi:hypothetical protein